MPSYTICHFSYENRSKRGFLPMLPDFTWMRCPVLEGEPHNSSARDPLAFLAVH